jgi:GT2 family glycosyltransferase
MKIAKLILHYNTPELTARLCKMVPDAIIVDNGSDTNFADFDIPNEIYRYPINLGFTPNWNRVLKELIQNTDYEAFWLMNSDITITRDSIQHIEEIMANNDIPMVTPSYNCWIRECHNHATGTFRQVRCIEFTAPVIRRDVFEKIGLFDNIFALGYGVEFDFALRMQNIGLKMYCDDGSSFYHLGQQTIHSQDSLKNYENHAKIELYEGMAKKYGENWMDKVTRDLKVYDFKKRNKVAVYTTIFGNYSPLFPIPKQTMPADYFCLTDDPLNITLLKKQGSEPIQILPVLYPRSDLHSRMKAKFYKLMPWECKELSHYETVIFIDASIEITSNNFVMHCLDHLKSDILLYKHPVRDCIYDEAKASFPLIKYQKEDIQLQIADYRKFFPHNAGLYACGIMVRKLTKPIMNLMTAWWFENIKYTYQDQISLPVICRLMKITPSTFPESQIKNQYFRIHWHDDKKQVIS